MPKLSQANRKAKLFLLNKYIRRMKEIIALVLLKLKIEEEKRNKLNKEAIFHKHQSNIMSPYYYPYLT